MKFDGVSKNDHLCIFCKPYGASTLEKKIIITETEFVTFVKP